MGRDEARPSLEGFDEAPFIGGRLLRSIRQSGGEKHGMNRCIWCQPTIGGVRLPGGTASAPSDFFSPIRVGRGQKMGRDGARPSRKNSTKRLFPGAVREVHSAVWCREAQDRRVWSNPQLAVLISREGRFPCRPTSFSTSREFPGYNLETRDARLFGRRPKVETIASAAEYESDECRPRHLHSSVSKKRTPLSSGVFELR